MFFSLFCLSFSWTPVFHQAFAAIYADKYYPNITSQQRKSFLIGSIYADGINKSISHFVRPIIRELNSIANRKGNLYWFFLGVLNHISIDTFAHSGVKNSLIQPYGMWHHAAELSVCSWAQRHLNASFLVISKELIHQIIGVGISVKRSFSYVYPVIYLVTKILPLNYLLPFVINVKNGNKRLTYKESEAVFARYIDAMLSASKNLMSHAHDATLNEIDVKEITIAELSKLNDTFDAGNVTTNFSLNEEILKLKLPVSQIECNL